MEFPILLLLGFTKGQGYVNFRFVLQYLWAIGTIWREILPICLIKILLFCELKNALSFSEQVIRILHVV